MSVPALRPRTAAAPQRSLRQRPPALVVVAPPAPRPSGLGFVLTCMAVLVAMMLGLLLLNVAISGNAFILAELSSARSVLTDDQQARQQLLARESAPESLAAKAQALGMVPAPTTLVLPAPVAQP